MREIINYEMVKIENWVEEMKAGSSAKRESIIKKEIYDSHLGRIKSWLRLCLAFLSKDFPFFLSSAIQVVVGPGTQIPRS